MPNLPSCRNSDELLVLQRECHFCPRTLVLADIVTHLLFAAWLERAERYQRSTNGPVEIGFLETS